MIRISLVGNGIDGPSGVLLYHLVETQRIVQARTQATGAELDGVLERCISDCLYGQDED